MPRSFIPLLLVMATFPLSNTFAQVNTQRGSVLGGLAGAAAGAAIGEHNDKPLAGALIGGAVGLMTGGALGNARDRQIAQNRAYNYQQQQYFAQQVAKTVTPHDVITMTRSGLSETVIINHIQANGVRQELQIADVITLHDNGVSERVISTMQRAHVGPMPTSASVAAPVQYQQAPPSIVVEQYVAPRYHYSPPPRYYGPRYPHPPSRHGHFSYHH